MFFIRVTQFFFQRSDLALLVNTHLITSFSALAYSRQWVKVWWETRYLHGLKIYSHKVLNNYKEKIITLSKRKLADTKWDWGSLALWLVLRLGQRMHWQRVEKQREREQRASPSALQPGPSGSGNGHILYVCSSCLEGPPQQFKFLPSLRTLFSPRIHSLLQCNKLPPTFNNKHLLSHTVLEGWESRSALAGWFSPRVSWACSQDVSLGCSPLKPWLELQDLISSSLMVLGVRSQVLTLWASPKSYSSVLQNGSWFPPKSIDRKERTRRKSHSSF